MSGKTLPGAKRDNKIIWGGERHVKPGHFAILLRRFLFLVYFGSKFCTVYSANMSLKPLGRCPIASHTVRHKHTHMGITNWENIHKRTSTSNPNQRKPIPWLGL